MHGGADRQRHDYRAFDEHVLGTWTETFGGGTATLTLSDDGEFVARGLPSALVCNRSTSGRELAACLADPGSSTISADGTWSVLDEEQGLLELESDGQLFRIAHRDMDGFSVGHTDKPEPDYVFVRSTNGSGAADAARLTKAPTQPALNRGFSVGLTGLQTAIPDLTKLQKVARPQSAG
ncbi:hypothetical protein NY588_06675 [Curtobacterium flaccumfaciens pv. beticola]|uniref:hypothetical protein n=1 Tax=Curtobacterium flaccumfaciens TaxID=2035 RepID=UPI00349F5601|nr:hypothetical protein [Curtobacterium flaccumfaciens pv. basellae]